jgi:hypothetical protein
MVSAEMVGTVARSRLPGLVSATGDEVLAISPQGLSESCETGLLQNRQFRGSRFRSFETSCQGQPGHAAPDFLPGLDVEAVVDAGNDSRQSSVGDHLFELLALAGESIR